MIIIELISKMKDMLMAQNYPYRTGIIEEIMNKNLKLSGRSVKRAYTIMWLKGIVGGPSKRNIIL